MNQNAADSSSIKSVPRNQVAAGVKVADTGFDVLTGNWSRRDERACTPAALSESLCRMDWMPVVVLAVGATLFLVLKERGQVSQAKALGFLQQGAKVVDVRSGQEFASGHLSNALNIPLDELESRIGQQAPNKEQVLLLHCVSGIRSGMGTRLLKRMGYTKVFNLGSYGRAERIVRQSQK